MPRSNQSRKNYSQIIMVKGLNELLKALYVVKQKQFKLVNLKAISDT
jgi:hypothetical protein